MFFEEGNKIKYGQDFSFWQGIPAGVDFRVSKFDSKSKCPRFKLTAFGYGDLSRPGGYGNGSLYVFGLTKEQQKIFEVASMS